MISREWIGYMYKTTNDRIKNKEFILLWATFQKHFWYFSRRVVNIIDICCNLARTNVFFFRSRRLKVLILYKGHILGWLWLKNNHMWHFGIHCIILMDIISRKKGKRRFTNNRFLSIARISSFLAIPIRKYSIIQVSQQNNVTSFEIIIISDI